MGSKEPEPWSPRWVRQQLRERRNSLPPNDLNHDEKLLANAERPLCKCDLECQHYMSIDHDTYNRRYWFCPQPTYPFLWGWDEEKLWKIVSVLIFILHILNNVIINHLNFLKDVRVELFLPPLKPPRYDFKQWIDDYITLKDIEYMAWVKNNRATMSKGGSTSQ
jgi:hypothetical protein